MAQIISEYTFLARYAEPVTEMTDSKARVFFLRGDDEYSVSLARTAMERLGFTVSTKRYPNQRVVYVKPVHGRIQFFGDWVKENLNEEISSIEAKLASIGYPQQMTAVAVENITKYRYGG